MTNRCMKICYLCIACVSLVLNYRSYNDTLATHFHHHDSFALSFDEPPVEKSSTDVFISTGVRGHEEKFVLAQLYERAKQSKEQCHAAGGGQQNNATSSYVDTSITGKALTEESSSLNVSSLLNRTMMRNDSATTPICYLPPKTLCTTEYTAVVIFHTTTTRDNNAPHRMLFMNLLSLLSRDDVAAPDNQSNTRTLDVIVIYHGAAEHLNRDKMYGRRILNWQEEKIIKLIYESEFENHTGSVEDSLFHPFHESLVKHISHDIILYLDGSMPITRKEKGGINQMGVLDTLQVGFQLIRQNPQSLVGNKVYQYSGLSDYTKKNIISDISATTINNFAPICNDILEKGSQESHISIMNFSGMFLHRNYLCFMWHQEFAALRQLIGSMTAQSASENDTNANSTILELTSLFVSSMVTQIGGKAPLMYPLVKSTWSETKQDPREEVPRRLSEIVMKDDGSVESDWDEPRRRRTYWNSANDTIVNQHYPAMDRRRLSESNLTIPFQPKLQPKSFQHLKASVSSKDVLSILNYFGSYSREPSCWCSVDGNLPIIGSQTSCLNQCHGGDEDISIRDLPWFVTGNRYGCS